MNYRNSLILGLALAIVAGAPNAHAGVFGTTYYAFSSKSCANMEVCVMDNFPNIPAANFLITKQVSCNFFATNTAVLHAVQVGAKTVAAQATVANAQYLDVPTLLGKEATYNYYQLNSTAMAPVTKGGAPAIKITLKAGVPQLSIFCSVAGELTR